MILRAVALALAGLLGLSAPMGGGGSAQAATLDVRGGILFGASGVVIGGRTFDVQFIDGSCAAIFDGCDSTSDLDFTDIASSRAAAQALGDQVVIDFGGFQFDSSPGLINGCPSSVFCQILIPSVVREGVSVDGATFISSASFDAVGSFGTSSLFDSANSGTDVYAQFTQVPIPAALPLMLGGLGLLALVGRRRRG